MLFNKPFTKENLDIYLKELGKEFRRLNGTKMPAEIVLIGGAAILANYGFREMTYDIDAVINASSAMKEAVNRVGDKLGLPNGWLNMDFQNTSSYSEKLSEVSVYYKAFSNILTVRTVAAEYLVAMKLMSGRQYKNDLSDIVGILWEHQKSGKPIEREAVDKAVIKLFGGWDNVPEVSRKLFESVFDNIDLESLFLQSKKNEKRASEILTEINNDYPEVIKGENIDTILEQARKRKKKDYGAR